MSNTTAVTNLTAGQTIRIVGIRPVHELIQPTYMENHGTILAISCGSIRKSSPVVTIASIDTPHLYRPGKGALREVTLTLTDGRKIVASTRQRVEVID